MRRRYIITLAVVCPLFVLWLILFMVPQKKSEKLIEQSLTESEKRVINYRTIMHEFPDYIQSRHQLFEKKKHLLSKLYSKDDLVKLFSRFENKSKGYDIRIIEITPSVDELLKLNRQLLKENKPQVLRIEIRMQAGLSDVGRFIQEIENEDFYFGLNFCQISNPPAGEEYSEIRFGFNAILGTIRDI